MGAPPPVTWTDRRIVEAGRRLLQEFEPTRVTGLTPRGEWVENPDEPSARISNEIFHRLHRMGEQKSIQALEEIAALFSKNPAVYAAKKLFSALMASSDRQKPAASEAAVDRLISISLTASGRPETEHDFLVIHGALVWVLLHEARRLGASAPVRSWDKSARARRRNAEAEYQKRLADRDALSEPENAALDEIQETIRNRPPAALKGIPEIIAEELDIDLTLSALLERARRPDSREESLGMIIEKLRPAQGIVDNATPALLRPSLNLLNREALDLDSGIPYNTAVILSILCDERSSAGLLSTLGRIPVSFSKIRENLIYTLGNLEREEAVPLIIPTLEAPDQAVTPAPDGGARTMLLREQKEEAIRALGKIGAAALPALPALLPYARHEHPILRAYLAWTLGSIGLAQKKRYDGVSADIVITLLELLKSKDRPVFEEAVAALRRIQMPEFLHTLYLYSVGAVSILGLKPAQRGLYELSETLHHLIETQGRAVIAVNGDSGTGKTYFCQAIAEGMGGVDPGEILYLMRDRRRDQKIFNRLLGHAWLKKHIDPSYYENDPPPENPADPESYFRDFLKEHADKKLILLDGCRDRHYFQRVIDLFYFHGMLDVEVNFRATLSTRRSNLEEREKALDSIKNHLAFLEEPSLEDTWFYREGRVILYDLDNSIGFRLGRDEIQELFAKRKISSWGDLIRIGVFHRPSDGIETRRTRLAAEPAPVASRIEPLPSAQKDSLLPRERKFRGVINPDRESRPHLLETIPLDDIKPNRLRLYAQEQIAGSGEEGEIFVLSFIDNRIFSHRLDSAAAFALHGRDIYAATSTGDLVGLSFERGEKWTYSVPGPSIQALSSFGDRGLLTGHRDGTIRVWDFYAEEIRVYPGHGRAVTGLATDYAGRVYSTGADATLRIWDPTSGRSRLDRKAGGENTRLRFYPPDRLLAVAPPGRVSLINPSGTEARSFLLPAGLTMNDAAFHPDGRILAAATSSRQPPRKDAGEIVILSPEPERPTIQRLNSHSRETHSLLLMGPRIITCGSDSDGAHSLKILGNEYFVRTEAARRELRPD